MNLEATPPAPRLPAWAERDTLLQEALGPFLTELRDRFVAAGWTRAEMHYAIMGWAATEATYDAHLSQTPEAYHSLSELPGDITDIIQRATAAVYGGLPAIQPYKAG